MNIDELKRSLTAIAEEARPELTAPGERIDAVDHKVRDHRRNLVVGTVAAAVAVAAVVVAPAVLGGDGHTPPADNKPDAGLPTVTEHGVSIYESPGGAKLIAHAVAAPGERSASVTFTPTTGDLSWTDFCYDAGVKGTHGAEFALTVNGHRISESTCQGTPEAPVGAEASFVDSPVLNARTFAEYGVEAGKPSTVKVLVTGSARSGVTPQPGIAVYERAPQLRRDGVWFDREVVYQGHSYRVVDSRVADLDGQKSVRVEVDLPRSPHRLYVATGTANVPRGLRLFPDSTGVSPLGTGVTASGSGDLVSTDRRTVMVRAHPMNPDASGQVYVLVYERVD